MTEMMSYTVASKKAKFGFLGFKGLSLFFACVNLGLLELPNAFPSGIGAVYSGAYPSVD